MAPPIKHSIDASNKNSNRILLFFAPMAFFNPITLVLSFTVTNIMLAMPNMPTIKLITPIKPPTMFTVPNKLVMALLNASTLFKEKLSSCLGANLLICLMMPSNSSLKAVVVTFVFPVAINTGLLFFSGTICLHNL